MHKIYLNNNSNLFWNISLLKIKLAKITLQLCNIVPAVCKINIEQF